MISILVAYDRNRVIGDRDTIPWRLSEDMKMFKERTLGNICIMGRKTWESFRNAPKPLYVLPGRVNVVITRDREKYATQFAEQIGENPVYFLSLEQALAIAKNWKSDSPQPQQLFVIGGEQIYKAFLDAGVVDKIIASEVDGEHEGDAFFPEVEGFTANYRQGRSGFTVVEYLKNEIKEGIHPSAA